MTGLLVSMTEDAEHGLREAAAAAAPYETGGILVGVLRDGHPWITTVIEIRIVSPSRVRFEIPWGVTPLLVDEARRVDPLLGYLGDWHSHAADAPPSPTDKATLAKESRRRRGRHATPALSLLVRGTAAGWRIEPYVDEGTGPRLAELTVTGPLEGATTDDRPENQLEAVRGR